MNELLRVYQEVQQRHAKRMVKLMEAALSASSEAQFELLEILIEEEAQKRSEDQQALYDSLRGAFPTTGGSRESLIQMLALEPTDDSVVHLFRRQFLKLKTIHGY